MNRFLLSALAAIALIAMLHALFFGSAMLSELTAEWSPSQKSEMGLAWLVLFGLAAWGVVYAWRRRRPGPPSDKA